MTKWKNRSGQGQSKRGRYDGKDTPGSIASCQRAGPVRGSSPWGAKEAKSTPGHGGGGARGRPAPPEARPLPLPARPRRSRKLGEGGRAKLPSESPGLGKPVVGPLRPAEPARELRDGARAMATPRHRPRVVPGPALGGLLLLLSVLALGRASPRLLDFPAPVCAQEVRLKPGGAGRSEDAGAVGNGGGVTSDRRRWEGRSGARRAVESGEGRRGCEGVGGPGSGRPGEELRGGPGRERDVEATPGVESRCVRRMRGTSRETTRAAAVSPAAGGRSDNSVGAFKLGDGDTRGWQL